MVGISTETNGRYTEIYIDGVEDGSIAFDEAEGDLIIDGEAEYIDGLLVIDLPSERDT